MIHKSLCKALAIDDDVERNAVAHICSIAVSFCQYNFITDSVNAIEQCPIGFGPIGVEPIATIINELLSGGYSLF